MKLKLLEIYQQRNDLNSFETLAEELYPAGGQEDQAIWSQVVQMGAKMNPDNPLFSQSGTEALYAAAEEAPGKPEVAPDLVAAGESETVDPTKNPFPQPDEVVGIDEEFDRLAEQMGLNEAAADATGESAEKSAMEEDSEMLDFASNERSELEFNLDIEGVDEQEEDRSDAATGTNEQPAVAQNEPGADDELALGVQEIDDIDLGELEADIPGVSDDTVGYWRYPATT